MNLKSSYRLQYYEDDVVIYTDSGKYPKLPKNQDKCTLYYGNHKHTLKKFYSEEQARIATKIAQNKGYSRVLYRDEDTTVFVCPKCCMYHAIPTNTYNKYFEDGKPVKRYY